MAIALVAETYALIMFAVNILTLFILPRMLPSWLGGQNVGWFSVQTMVALAIMVAMQRKIAAGSPCTAHPDLSGKWCVVTGSNTGIGYHTAVGLLKLNANVIFACRTESRATAAMDAAMLAVETSTKGSVHFVKLDIADLQSVRAAAAEIILKTSGSLDILVNNAGLMVHGIEKTKDGFEQHIGTNHLGPFLLTELLIPSVITAKGRIVNVASVAHRWFPMPESKSKTPITDAVKEIAETGSLSVYPRFALPSYRYFYSKACNIMVSDHWAHSLKGTGVKVTSVHPGSVATEIVRNQAIQWVLARFGLLFIKSAEEGAQTSLHCALSPEIVNGGFYADSTLHNEVRRVELTRPEDIAAMVAWSKTVTNQGQWLADGR